MTIESKELMIGNFVNLTKDNFKTVKPYMMEGVDIYKVDESDCYDIQPIPLTEDWLLKFGFNKDYKKGYIGIDVNNSDFVLTEPFIIGEWQNYCVFEFKTGLLSRFTEVKYVHQLQNIFFALTGKELEIK